MARDGRLIDRDIQSGIITYNELEPQDKASYIKYGEDQGFISRDERKQIFDRDKLPTLGTDIAAIATGPLRAAQSTFSGLASLPGIAVQKGAKGTERILGLAEKAGQILPQPVREFQQEQIGRARSINERLRRAGQESVSGFAQETVLDRPLERASAAGRIGGGALESAFDIATGALTGAPLAFLGTKAGVSGTTEALEKGADVDKALAVGAGKGLVEAATEFIPIGRLGKAFKAPLRKAVANYVASTATDIIGENIANLGQSTIDKIAFDEGDPIRDTISQIPETTIQTILLGLIMAGGGAANAGIQNKINNQETVSPDEIIDGLQNVAEQENTTVEELVRENVQVPERDVVQPEALEAERTLEQVLQEGELGTSPQLNIRAEQAAEREVTPADRRRQTEFLNEQLEDIAPEMNELIKFVNESKKTNIDADKLEFRGNNTIEQVVDKITRSGDEAIKATGQRFLNKLIFNAKAASTATQLNNLRKLDSVIEGTNFRRRNKLDKDAVLFAQGIINESDLTKKYSDKDMSDMKRVIDFVSTENQNMYELADQSLVARGERGLPFVENYFRITQGDVGESFKDFITALSDPLQGRDNVIKKREAFEKKLSIQKKRGESSKATGGLIDGYLDYTPQFAFLTNINPQINLIRKTGELMNQATNGALQNLEKTFSEHSDLLAGNQTFLDKKLEEGAPGFYKFLVGANRLARANKVGFKASTVAAQPLNLSNGALELTRGGKDKAVTGLMAITKTIGDFTQGSKSEAYQAMRKSPFIRERTLDLDFMKYDPKLLKAFESVKKGAEVTDLMTTGAIWMSGYNQGKMLGVENPTEYADKLTRSAVGGRGIAERTQAQQSELYKMIAPFTLEANNTFRILKSAIKDPKDWFGVAMYLVVTQILGNLQEKVMGRRGTSFDYFDVTKNVVDEDLNAKEAGLRYLAETLNSVPFGSSISDMMPDWFRDKYFGQEDPSRFGTGPMALRDVFKGGAKLVEGDVAGGLGQLAETFTPTAGGSQISQTLRGAKVLREGELRKEKEIKPLELESLKEKKPKELIKLAEERGIEFTRHTLEDGFTPDNQKIREELIPKLSESVTGEELKAVIDTKPTTVLKGLLFGPSAIPEIREYYENVSRALSTKQTRKYDELVKKGYEGEKLFTTLRDAKGIKRSKANLRAHLQENGYSNAETNEILKTYFGYK